MHKALATICGLRTPFVFRESVQKITGDLERVDQLAFGIAGMRRDAIEMDRCAIGTEGLVFVTTELTAIDGIAVIGSEFFDVNLIDSAANLFVRGKEDADIAVRDRRIID